MRGTPDTFRLPNGPGGMSRAGVPASVVLESVLLGSVLLASVLMVGACLPGCESTPTVKGDAERPAASSPVAAKTKSKEAASAAARNGGDPAASAQALALREQADRDMEALRSLRRNATSEPSTPGLVRPTRTESGRAESGRAESTRAESTRAGAKSAPRAAPPEPKPAAIIWNDPRAVATTGGGSGAAPPALARPEESTTVAPYAGRGAGSASEQLELNTLSMKLVQLRQDLYRESVDSEQPVRELLAIAAMAIVNPDLELPQGTDRSLTPEELELLEQLHRFFIELGRKLDNAHEAEETIVNAVLELQNAIVKKPQLELPSAALCWRIGGFGDYDRFERDVFLAHDEQQVILYLEIDGFTSTLNQREQWVTEVSQQLEIFSDRDGIPVWSEGWQKAVDVINNKRRDFFTTQLITLPAALSVGKYHLKIRVRDEQSGAEAEESIAFEMVADAKMAARVGK